MGLCPFHTGRRPLLSVRSEPPLFHCFGCGARGDIFKFAMLHHRAGFRQAVEAVAKHVGVMLPDESRSSVSHEEVLAALDAAAAHYRTNLYSSSGRCGRDYLASRGLIKSTIERVGAGMAADAWDDLLRTLERRFETTLLVKAGLVAERRESRRVYDRLRNRLVFPIWGEDGHVLAFGARTLDATQPKYLNTPGSPVFRKGRTLYGVPWATRAAADRGHVVIVEGYLDAAAALQCGVEQVVASCGTSLTHAQAQLLGSLADRVVVCFDQDTAGRQATRRCLALLFEQQVDVSVVDLPSGHDPASLACERGTETLAQRLQQATPGLQWLIQDEVVRHDTTSPCGKADFLSALTPALLRVKNLVERAAWIEYAARTGALDAAAATEELCFAASQSNLYALRRRGPAQDRARHEGVIPDAGGRANLLGEGVASSRGDVPAR